jgi:hypothetical protein
MVEAITLHHSLTILPPLFSDVEEARERIYIGHMTHVSEREVRAVSLLLYYKLTYIMMLTKEIITGSMVNEGEGDTVTAGEHCA